VHAGHPRGVDGDRDGDGIPDSIDKCPDEPEDRDMFQDEDGCPDLDNDGDGIPDAKDKCPLDPEDKDGFQDEDGCPDPDNDGDGIPDRLDACPNEPETKNGIADDDGCPDTVPADLVAALAGASARFEPGRARITASTKHDLAALLAALEKYPDVKIVVTGHGTTALAKRRAEGVKWYLVGQTVLADRITTRVTSAAGGAISVELATP
jgi:outer membrane protein OmpA-like peptidoglycan-associated protein